MQNSFFKFRHLSTGYGSSDSNQCGSKWIQIWIQIRIYLSVASICFTFNRLLRRKANLIQVPSLFRLRTSGRLHACLEIHTSANYGRTQQQVKQSTNCIWKSGIIYLNVYFSNFFSQFQQVVIFLQNFLKC